MPGVNYHNAQTVNYICPFFQSEVGLAIRCEGLMDETTHATFFQRKKGLESYRAQYCFTFEHSKCHWARALLDNKYHH